MSTTIATTIDVQSIPPRERHGFIFATFDALGVGEALQLVNDHDPRPLRFQFNDRNPGQYDWSYIESGPQTWRVNIKRIATSAAAAANAGSCCSGGGCGG